jgi:hypothetical protein
MLGRLKMIIGKYIDAYLSLSDRIFQKKRHRVTIQSNIQERFDSEKLARAVKEVVTAQNLKKDALPRTNRTIHARCKLASYPLRVLAIHYLI